MVFNDLSSLFSDDFRCLGKGRNDMRENIFRTDLLIYTELLKRRTDLVGHAGKDHDNPSLACSLTKIPEVVNTG